MKLEGRRGTESKPSATPARHAGVPGWGVDRRQEDRPGVPKEAPPHPLPGAHWQEPPRQIPTAPVLKEALRKELTPVFSTAEPPRGLSGALRRLAYRVPDHKAYHWAILLLADRVDAVESFLAQQRR